MATTVDQPFTMPSKTYEYDSKKHKSNNKAIEDIILSMTGQLVPVGFVGIYSGAIVPAGWLACNGAAISRTEFAALFNIHGTTSGSGDGVTTFNVPTLASPGTGLNYMIKT